MKASFYSALITAVNLVIFNDYLLFEKVYSIDENAEQTKLILRKNIDISEVNYVD